MGAKEYAAYVSALNQASLLAQREFDGIWRKLDAEGKPEATRDALIAVVPGIVWKYGGMAALAAAEYFESERREATGDDSRASIADGVPYEKIEASVRYACGHLFPEEGEDEAPTRPGGGLFGGQD